MSLPFHRYGHEAMATHFQLMFPHDDELIANGIAQGIFRDIDRLETELSRFVPYSDISAINRAEVGEATSVAAACLDCLLFGKSVWEATNGAFDITIGPLIRLLHGPDGRPRRITKSERESAMASVGFQHLEIDDQQMTVTKHAPEMSLDLGAIGKGYALDQAQFNLQEQGIQNALLNAGDSTVLALGSMPRNVAGASSPPAQGWPVRAGQENPVILHNNALSGSGFIHQGAHILDPRTGRTVNTDRYLRWAIAPNATLADAFSTAFLVMSRKEIATFCQHTPDIQVLFAA